MPYIPAKARQELSEERWPNTPGELNYLISQTLKSYWVKSARNYQAINDISGAATEALAEFRRRVVAPYEDEAIKRNGDIF